LQEFITEIFSAAYKGHLEAHFLKISHINHSNVQFHVRVLSLVLVLYSVYMPYKALHLPYKACIPSVELVLEMELSHEIEHKSIKFVKEKIPP